MLNSKGVLLLAGAAVALYAAPASAGTKIVDFSFKDGATTVGSGSFSYDSSLNGQIDYSDLTSFSFSVPGMAAYDLNFVNSGSFSQYYYFGFNADLNTFTSVNITGFPQILSAIKSDFNSGFFVRNDSTSVLRDYAPGGTTKTFNNVSISVSTIGGAVPEPATWVMMIMGFGLIGGAMRYRKRQQPNVRFAF